MSGKISWVNKLKLVKYIGDMQLQHLDEFDEKQQDVLRKNMFEVNQMLYSPECSENDAKRIIAKLHPAFQYYSNSFSVLYKISRASVEDVSAECYFYPYREHHLNIDETFFDRDGYVNREVYEPNRQQAEDIQYTGAGTHGLCFIQNEKNILEYLGYGSQLTISILDPLIFPLYKTLVRTQVLSGRQFQVSQAYIAENILLDDYRVIKQILYRANNLEEFFLRPEFDWTIAGLISNIKRRSPNSDTIEFLSCLKDLYLSAKQDKEKFLSLLEGQFPEQAYCSLFDARKIIESERAFLGISETVEESLGKILGTEKP